MAAVSTTAKIPSPLNLSNRLHQGENWKLFRREWKFYELAAGIHKKSEEVRVASLLNVVGKEGMDMYETFQWDWKSLKNAVFLLEMKRTKGMFFSKVISCQASPLTAT